MSDQIPRRNDLARNTGAELAIRDAIWTVEKAGADIRLTDAVVLLGMAQDSVADYVDGVPRRPWHQDELARLRAKLGEYHGALRKARMYYAPKGFAMKSWCDECGQSTSVTDVAEVHGLVNGKPCLAAPDATEDGG